MILNHYHRLQSSSLPLLHSTLRPRSRLSNSITHCFDAYTLKGSTAQLLWQKKCASATVIGLLFNAWTLRGRKAAIALRRYRLRAKFKPYRESRRARALPEPHKLPRTHSTGISRHHPKQTANCIQWQPGICFCSNENSNAVLQCGRGQGDSTQGHRLDGSVLRSMESDWFDINPTGGTEPCARTGE